MKTKCVLLRKVGPTSQGTAFGMQAQGGASAPNAEAPEVYLATQGGTEHYLYLKEVGRSRDGRRRLQSSFVQYRIVQE